jgi:hypothetical protein
MEDKLIGWSEERESRLADILLAARGWDSQDGEVVRKACEAARQAYLRALDAELVATRDAITELRPRIAKYCPSGLPIVDRVLRPHAKGGVS